MLRSLPGGLRPRNPRKTNTTTLQASWLTDDRVLQEHAYFVQTSQGSPPVAVGGVGVALLGDKETAADGLGAFA